MSEATAPQPIVEPATLEQLVAAGNAQVARATDEMARVNRTLIAAQSGALPLSSAEYLAGFARIADIQFEILAYRKAVEEAATLRSMREMRQERAQALAQVPEPEPARHRHRKPRQARPHAERNLRPLGLAVPGLAAALRHGARHAWAAHPIAAITTPATAMALTAAVVSLGHVHTLEDRTHLPAISALPSVSAPAVPVHFASSPDPDYAAPVAYRKPPKPLAVAAPAVTVTQDPPDSSQSQDQSQQQGDGQGNGQGQGQQGNGGYQGRHRGQDGDHGWQGGGQGHGQDGGGHGRHAGN